ncbi:MAG: hypothetical protein MMC33_010105, partial [Icmadophila ericetorum]|nr:hypothetical protein [Icmadophila ericetorum]
NNDDSDLSDSESVLNARLLLHDDPNHASLEKNLIEEEDNGNGQFERHWRTIKENADAERLRDPINWAVETLKQRHALYATCRHRLSEQQRDALNLELWPRRPWEGRVVSNPRLFKNAPAWAGVNQTTIPLIDAEIVERILAKAVFNMYKSRERCSKSISRIKSSKRATIILLAIFGFITGSTHKAKRDKAKGINHNNSRRSTEQIFKA